MNKDLVCSVEGCTNTVKAKNLCGKHYMRKWTHGDVTVDYRSGPKDKYVICYADNCINKAICKGLCAIHYGRQYRHDSHESRMPTYGQGIHYHEQGYKMLLVDGKYKMEHIIIAEKALGKPLPKNAVIHHMNGNVTDNITPFNLVICPDQSYHMLLHRRMKGQTE